MRSAEKTTHARGTKQQRFRRLSAVRILLILSPVIAAPAIQEFAAPGRPATSSVALPAESTLLRPSLSAPATAPPTAAAPPNVQELPPSAPPRQLFIDGADTGVPILPLMPDQDDVAAQSIVPPETTDGYWLAGYGQPGLGSANTTYIAGHSWTGRDSLFNRLSSEVDVGETVTLVTDSGTIDYVVDSVTTHDKDTLKTSDIWRVIPNRLVIISCFTEDLWGKNVIVSAMPAAGEAG